MARRVGATLAIVSVALVVLSGLTYVAWVLAVRGDYPEEGQIPDGFAGVVHRVWAIVDVAVERSVPTWFNAMLWALLGFVAFAASRFSRRRVGWVVFGVVAMLASLDETVSLHERLQELGAGLTEAWGVGIVYAWVIPGIVIAVGVAVALWPLVRTLPRESMRLILAGGALFLAGAVALETLSGQFVGQHGAITWQNMLVSHVEELFEKLGIVLAIMGVVRLFSVAPDAGGGVPVAFAQAGAPGPVGEEPAG